jgi:RimJ/RimL family protein N-acetyltransferase
MRWRWPASRLSGPTVASESRSPGNFVLGYWLGGALTSKGYATEACKTLIAYGKAAVGATTIYAGVTKGNA